MNEKTENPAFEVHTPDQIFKIYASGKVEGFGETGVIICNRIPQLVAKAVANATGSSNG